MPQGYHDVNILIVDDDQVDVRAIQRGFQKHKISNPMYVASDGLEALSMLRGDQGQPKLPRPYLILLDLNMPRMNGHQFLKELRSDPGLSDSIVFVLTTSVTDEDKVAAYQQHIAGYLVKSEVGHGFLTAIEMLERFVVTVQFPPEQV